MCHSKYNIQYIIYVKFIGKIWFTLVADLAYVIVHLLRLIRSTLYSLTFRRCLFWVFLVFLVFLVIFTFKRYLIQVGKQQSFLICCDWARLLPKSGQMQFHCYLLARKLCSYIAFGIVREEFVKTLHFY